VRLFGVVLGRITIMLLPLRGSDVGSSAGARATCLARGRWAMDGGWWLV
jgi:hypothetical protein